MRVQQPGRGADFARSSNLSPTENQAGGPAAITLEKCLGFGVWGFGVQGGRKRGRERGGERGGGDGVGGPAVRKGLLDSPCWTKGKGFRV